MKKVFAVLLAVMLLVSVFTACSASKSAETMPQAQPSYAPEAPAADGGSYDYADKDESYAGEPIIEELGSTGVGFTGSGTAIPPSQKMIFTVTADIETTKFDESLNNVTALMTAYGAYVESSYVSGKKLRRYLLRLRDIPLGKLYDPRPRR